MCYLHVFYMLDFVVIRAAQAHSGRRLVGTCYNSRGSMWWATKTSVNHGQ